MGEPDRLRAILLCQASAALILGYPQGALADPETERIQIIFQAPAACPSQDAFTDEVRARTRAAFVSAGRASNRTFRIRIHQHKQIFTGRVIQERPGGISKSDDIHWENCGDLISALAIKTALAIDDHTEAPMPPLLPALKPPPPQPFLHSLATIPSFYAETPPFHVSFGTQFSAAGALSPGFAPASAFFIDLSRTGDGAEAFSLRLSVLRAHNHVIVHREIFSMEWIAGRLEGCPLHRRDERFTFIPCVGIDAGTIEWTANPPGVTRYWISGNLIARIQFSIVGPLLAEAQASLVIPFIRDRFGLGSQESSGLAVHKVPILSGSAGAGLALRFP